MSLAVFRSARAEDLASALARQLQATPCDPFEPVAIVVGSRGMERWLRHQLATRLGIAANLDFPFPRQALDGLAARLLAGEGSAAAAVGKAAADRWQGDALTFRVVAALRARLDHPEFTNVRAYLQDGDAKAAAASGTSAVEFRELAFAREVADVLDKLLHDRHADALQWATAPEQAGPHAWLAGLLADLGAAEAESPAQVRARLLAQPPQTVANVAPLRLFCLSTLGPSDREMLAALAARVPVELYLLAPSQAWWADIHSRSEHFRALQRAATAADLAELERERTSQNRLLAGLGIPSRDVQIWLETLTYSEPTLPRAPAEVGSDLQRVQAWIGAAGDTDELAQAGLQADGSLALHSCWGALRQVEVLRDQLLDLFQRHPGAIEPRDVLVMTPDIETFAPLVAAVFARRGPLQPPESSQVPGQTKHSTQLPAIPVSIADLGLVRVNPVAEALLAALALADGRVSAPQLYALLALEPVRLRLELSVDDVADLRELIDESGMRWALDAQDRAAADQPELEQNTLDFGLERLALGALLADPLPGEVVALAGADVVPVPLASAERVRRVAALAQVVGAVRAARERQNQQRGGRTLRQWLGEWHTLLDDFTQTTAKAGWLTAQVRGELEALVQAGEQLQPVGTADGSTELRLSLAAVRRALRSRFDLPVRGDRAITGAVTVCALQPMRSVPFQVIALLGMDDGAFPVARTRRAWDPFGQAKPGELDPRLTQRHLLLETLLSARERLLVFWNGFGSKPGEVHAPAVPIVELRDLLAETSALPVDRWVTEHPLQPWSPRTFGPGHFTYDAAMARAAAELMQVQAGQRQPAAVGLAATRPGDCLPETNPPASVTIDELARGLARAGDLFLRDRLQLVPARDPSELQDREPLELSGLDHWGVRDEVLRALLDQPDSRDVPAQVTRRLQAQGRLPLQAGGQRLVQDVCATVAELLQSYRQVQGEPVGPAAPLRADVSLPAATGLRTVQVQGPDLAGHQLGGEVLLEWLSPSRSDSAKALLRSWVYLLVARASGRPATAIRAVGHGDAPSGGSRGRVGQVAGTVLASTAQPQQASELLADLVALWQACRDRPLPLFAKSSLAWAQTAGAAPGKQRAAVRGKWQGTDDRDPGDTSDAAVRSLFAGWDPTEHLDPSEGPESFAGLALRVYGPILDALAAGTAVSAQFFAPRAADAEEAA